MKTVINTDVRTVTEAVHYRPAVSIILPFATKINLNSELHHSLKIVADKAERELLKNYPSEISTVIMKKLRDLIENASFDKKKKSIAIYVSPLFEKIYYLDFEVKEKMVIDDSFEIRDLVYAQKQSGKNLLLTLNAQECHLYLAGPSDMDRLELDVPESVAAYTSDMPERVLNFSDPTQRREMIRDKFLHHIDRAMDKLLGRYSWPLFIFGSEKILGHFKKTTRHRRAIAGYVKGNYDKATFSELSNALEPFQKERETVMQERLLATLEAAAGKGKLVWGIKDVWREAKNHGGALLIVEKDYMYAARHGAQADSIEAVTEPSSSVQPIWDAVDDVIESILKHGGDIAFTDNSELDNFDHIALIKFY